MAMFTANPSGTTSQTKYPVRTIIRTVFQVIVALAVGLPFLVNAAGLDETVPGVAVVLAVAAAITRVMALPWTEEFLERFIPWLASEPAQKDVSGDEMNLNTPSGE